MASMDLKRAAFGCAAALLALAIWLAWLWQPERQIRLHTAHLLGGIERRSWKRVGDFLADDYSDRWGHDKAFVIEGLRQVFGNFLFLRIEHRVIRASVSGSEGACEAQVKISGQGGPIAQLVATKVNGLAEPFTFTWRQRSGWPWDWDLSRVDHPTLNPDAEWLRSL